MNATLKTILICAAVVIVFKALDKLFLDKHVWSMFNFEGEE